VISKTQKRRDSRYALVSLTKYKRLWRLSETAVWQVRLSEVRRQIVPDAKSSCSEGSVARSWSAFDWREAYIRKRQINDNKWLKQWRPNVRRQSVPESCRAYSNQFCAV